MDHTFQPPNRFVVNAGYTLQVDCPIGTEWTSGYPTNNTYLKLRHVTFRYVSDIGRHERLRLIHETFCDVIRSAMWRFLPIDVVFSYAKWCEVLWLVRYGESGYIAAPVVGVADTIFFFLHIYSGIFVYTEYLCRLSEASTRYCIIPGGYPPQDWQSLPCAGEELDSNPADTIYSSHR